MQEPQPRRSPLPYVALASTLLLLGGAVFVGLRAPSTEPPVVIRGPAKKLPSRRARTIELPRPEPIADAPMPAAPPAEPPPSRDAPQLQPVELQTATESMEDGMALATEDCIRPMADAGELPSSELILHVVYTDGLVSDIRLRTLSALPEGLVDCMADALWQVDWPEFEGAQGESRLQRVIRTP